MASYRFCRPDDIPLLVQAVNACLPENAPWDVDRFKTDVRELDLWPGSCVVASNGDRPVSVLMTARREGKAHVLQLATHPEFQREGHAGHLLQSLRQKVDILTPGTTMEVIIPSHRDDLSAFFASQGYDAAETYADYEAKQQCHPEPFSHAFAQGRLREGSDFITPIVVDDVCDLPYFSGPIRAWERSPRTLQQRAKKLAGLAIPTVDGYVAYVLFATVEDKVNVYSFGCADGQDRHALLSLLIGALREQTIFVPRIASDELTNAELIHLGFQKATEYTRWEQLCA